MGVKSVFLGRSETKGWRDEEFVEDGWKMNEGRSGEDINVEEGAGEEGADEEGADEQRADEEGAGGARQSGRSGRKKKSSKGRKHGAKSNHLPVDWCDCISLREPHLIFGACSQFDRDWTLRIKSTNAGAC